MSTPTPNRPDPNPVAPCKTPDRFNPLERRIHKYLYRTLHDCNRTEIARVTGLSRSQVSRMISDGRGVEGFVKVLLILAADQVAYRAIPQCVEMAWATFPDSDS